MSDPQTAPDETETRPDPTSPNDPTTRPDGAPVDNPSGSGLSAKYGDGNTDAESDSDVASGGSPD